LKRRDFRTWNQITLWLQIHFGKGRDTTAFIKHFNWKFIIRMMMYVGNTTCPGIAFAVDQCGQFLYDPREIHATAHKELDAI